MRSKISIDLDEENRSVISISRIQSEDLKDKVVSRFTESFPHTNGWCTFEFTGDQTLPTRLDASSIYVSGSAEKIKNFSIKPITDKELLNEHGRIGRYLMEKNQLPLPKLVKYSHEDDNFLYTMFKDSTISVEAKSPSINADDAAFVLVDMMSKIFDLVMTTERSAKVNQALGLFEQKLHSSYKAFKDAELIEISEIQGRKTTLDFLKSLYGISYDWVWLAHTGKLFINGNPVLESDLKEQMNDLSADSDKFGLSGLEEFILIAADKKYLLKLKV